MRSYAPSVTGEVEEGTRMPEKGFIVRAKAWSNRGVVEARVVVDSDGTVWVWDDVARGFTLTHALSENAKKRIRRLAKTA
jgi:hypothetical protein